MDRSEPPGVPAIAFINEARRSYLLPQFIEQFRTRSPAEA